LTTPPRYPQYQLQPGHSHHHLAQTHYHQQQFQQYPTSHQHQHHHDPVNTVGLGISNVHFDDGRYILPANQVELTQEEEMVEEVAAYIEGEPEMDSDDDHLVPADDSDDEFIPGKNKRQKKKGRTGKKVARTSIKSVKR
jgi:hypothetical protein